MQVLTKDTTLQTFLLRSTASSHNVHSMAIQHWLRKAADLYIRQNLTVDQVQIPSLQELLATVP